MSRLASGMRINSAKDDAAGLQISNRLTSQINGLNVAVRNANDGISLAQTAEGALQESTNILHRMRDLAIQSANATNSSVDRKSIQEEVIQLKSELERIATTTTFGGQQLLNGSFGSKQLQVGSQANETIAISINSAKVNDLSSSTYTLGDAFGIGSAATSMGSPVYGTNSPLASTNETLTLNGINQELVSIDQFDAASEVASKINSVSNATGIIADSRTVLAMSNYSNSSVGDSISFDLSNGSHKETISFSSSGSAHLDFQKLQNKINESAAVLGISAHYFPKESNGAPILELASEGGNNITISNWNDLTDGNATIDVEGGGYDGVRGFGSVLTLNAVNKDVTVKGQVKLDSSTSFNVTSSEANSDLTGATVSGAVIQSSEVSIASIDVTTPEGSQNAISVIDGAIAKIDKSRATLGAIQNRLNSTIQNLSNISENSSGARARIRDTNFAKETAQLTKHQILQQAGTSILSQANQLPQAALSLLN